MKAKIFYSPNTKALEKDINQWLSQNSNIDIISTDFFGIGALGYIILYKDSWFFKNLVKGIIREFK